jgi:hypothetical protein
LQSFNISCRIRPELVHIAAVAEVSKVTAPTTQHIVATVAAVVEEAVVATEVAVAFVAVVSNS